MAEDNRQALHASGKVTSSSEYVVSLSLNVHTNDGHQLLSTVDCDKKCPNGYGDGHWMVLYGQ